MALYEDGSFLTPFGLNPILQHDQTMYIGVFLLDKICLLYTSDAANE